MTGVSGGLGGNSCPIQSGLASGQVLLEPRPCGRARESSATATRQNHHRNRHVEGFRCGDPPYGAAGRVRIRAIDRPLSEWGPKET